MIQVYPDTNTRPSQTGHSPSRGKRTVRNRAPSTRRRNRRPRLDLARVAADLAADRGWYVFPVVPGKNAPPVVKWSEEYSNDPDYILRAWPSPAHNIGITCGPSGLLVVDPDVKHGFDGPGALTEILAQDGGDGEWPWTYTVATPSGGFHLYFKLPDEDWGKLMGEDWGNGRGSLPDDIDIRGDGGYVVAAGSWRDDYGRAYEVHGGTGDADIAAVPPRILELIKTEPERSVKAGQRRRRPMGRVKAERAILGILKVIIEAPDGQLNNRLYWGACRAGEMIATGDWNPDEAETDLTIAARTANLEEHRIAPTINSGIRTGMAS